MLEAISGFGVGEKNLCSFLPPVYGLEEKMQETKKPR